MCKQDNPTRSRDVSPGIVCTKSAQNPCLFLIRRGSRLFLWTLTFAHKNKAGQHFIMRLFPPRYFLQGVGFTFCTINSYRRVIASEQVPGLKVSPAACMSPAQLLLFNVPNKGRETFDFDQGFEKHHIYRGRTFSFSLHQGTFQDGNAALSSLSQRWPGVGKLLDRSRASCCHNRKVFYPQIQQQLVVYNFGSIFWVFCRVFDSSGSSYCKLKTNAYLFVDDR